MELNGLEMIESNPITSKTYKMMTSCSSTNTTTDEPCNASSTTNTLNGTNSTTSSKIVLNNASPTDTLSPLLKPKSLQTNQFEDNAYQIMKLINERKQCVSPILANNLVKTNNYDLYSFSVFNSGGFIDIPKFSSHLMLPDNTITNGITVGIFKTNNSNFIHLENDQTLLSSMFFVSPQHQQTNDLITTKPFILSFDQSAQFVDTDWNISIFYKGLNENKFEELNESECYSHIVSNRCYLIAEKFGIYALVGRPKSTESVVLPSKEMKYAILLVNGTTVRVYLISNTKASTEIFNEEIQKKNSKVIKMPQVFELNLPNKSTKQDDELYLSLDVNVVYSNKMIGYDSISRKIRLNEIWNSSKDFIEIDVPITIDSDNNNNNFDLNVKFKHYDDCLIFSYSNTNNLDLMNSSANCNQQQEFYSSVSVNPIFLPLK